MSSDLHARLLDEANRYDPAAHVRSLLDPFKDVLLTQRAKFMSYEQIAAHFTGHGLKVSPNNVGYFCRRHFTKADIERKRAELSMPAAAAPTSPNAERKPVDLAPPGRRGPKIARDDY